MSDKKKKLTRSELISRSEMAELVQLSVPSIIKLLSLRLKNFPAQYGVLNKENLWIKADVLSWFNANPEFKKALFARPTRSESIINTLDIGLSINFLTQATLQQKKQCELKRLRAKHFNNTNRQRIPTPYDIDNRYIGEPDGANG